jgi:hypothetical protein
MGILVDGDVPPGSFSAIIRHENRLSTSCATQVKFYLFAIVTGAQLGKEGMPRKVRS